MKYSDSRMSGWGLAAACALLLSVCGPARAAFTREVVASGFATPLQLTAPPGDTVRLFVVERGGTIRIINKATSTVLGTPFLDVNASPNSNVNSSGEGGLLGLAFHPNYSSNGFFFVYYTADVDPGAGFQFGTRVSRFTVTGSPDVASPASETVFFELNQPFTNHNGGMIAFRPADAGNNLYVGLGDGGGACDTSLNSQNLNSKLGKMLRIDVDSGPSGDLQNPYAPASNPFVGVAGDDLIWSLGWRNPFRWSFDRATGDMYVGDVGQNTREEVSFEAANAGGGLNFGWNAREGTIAAPCSPVSPTLPGMVEPIYDYGHNGSASITGGVVYRGLEYASMYGRYFFADFVTQDVWSFVKSGNGVIDFQDHTAVLNPNNANVVAIGEDAEGDIYIVEFGGTIARITDPASSGVDLDQDLIEDQYESDTGIFVSATDTGTDPGDMDSDDDGVMDGTEVELGTNPNDVLDFPDLPVVWGWSAAMLAALAVFVIAYGVARRRTPPRH